MDAPAPKGHSPLGMSVLERRFSCPGSMRMEDGKPNTTSPYARRGTELHAVAAACLDQDLDAIDTIPDDPDGAAIVQDYLDVIRAKRETYGGTLLVEQGFHLSSLHDLYWGTADAVLVSPPVLFVADLKTGAGHGVPIRRDDGRANFQLGGYALGALHALPGNIARQIDTIELCVVQPRLGPPRATVMTIAEMQDLAADLVDIAEAATTPDAPLAAGEHCAFCRAAGECPELRRVALEAVDMEFDIVTDGVVLPPPAALSPVQLSRVLSAADLVETWIAAVRAHATALAIGGAEVPGWKIVDKRARRVWTDEHDAVRTLATIVPDAGDLYESKVVSPAQAEKLLKRLKLKRPKEWDDIVTMSRPGTTLAPAADPRPAVAARLTADEFEVVEQEEQ